VNRQQRRRITLPAPATHRAGSVLPDLQQKIASHGGHCGVRGQAAHEQNCVSPMAIHRATLQLVQRSGKPASCPCGPRLCCATWITYRHCSSSQVIPKLTEAQTDRNARRSRAALHLSSYLCTFFAGEPNLAPASATARSHSVLPGKLTHALSQCQASSPLAQARPQNTSVVLLL